MTILALIFMGLLTTFVCACEGDFGPAKTLGTIVIYVVAFGFFFWFLAVTGWVGLILFLIIGILVSIGLSSK